jgi:hypothetical protein
VSDANADKHAVSATETESIPGADVVTRLVDSPRMYEHTKGLIWASTFEFPQGAGESVNWEKYAPLPDEVHRLGKERESAKRETRPEFTYAGFIPVRAESVRKIRTARGHGFEVEHVPSEGIHHAEIRRVPSAERPLEKADKVELRFALEQAFGPLVPCPPDA